MKHSFRGIRVFDKLGNPNSVVHKLLVSPFLKNLKMTHNHRDHTFYKELKSNGRVMSQSPERATYDSNRPGQKPVKKSQRAKQDEMRDSIASDVANNRKSPHEMRAVTT